MTWNEIKQRRGVVTLVARTLGISTAAVAQWTEVPRGRRDQVAEALNISADEIGPAQVAEDAA